MQANESSKTSIISNMSKENWRAVSSKPSRKFEKRVSKSRLIAYVMIIDWL